MSVCPSVMSNPVPYSLTMSEKTQHLIGNLGHLKRNKKERNVSCNPTDPFSSFIFFFLKIQKFKRLIFKNHKQITNKMLKQSENVKNINKKYHNSGTFP